MMIEVRNVTKFFGAAKVINGLSFTVAAGEKLVLLGTSGCGKTTTLKMLNRLLDPDQGDIFINGENIRNATPQLLRRGIGYVIQQGGLFPHYSVFENIALVPRLLEWPEKRIQERVTELLHVMGLSPNAFASKYPAQLSGGQIQRVGLARALAAHPPVVLMDEPFGALDPITRSRLRQEFRQVGEWKQKTIVLVTHDVTEAFLLADRIALMDAGQIQQIGSPQALLLQPQNEFVRKFFDHQRLQLTWMVKSITDLLPKIVWLPEVQHATPIVRATQTLWEALEMAQHTPSTTVGIRDESGIRYTHWQHILAAAFKEP